MLARQGRRNGITVGVVSALLVVGVSPARASVTLGQLAPPNPPSTCTDVNPFDLVQPAVSSGNSYVVPSTIFAGRITSWSHNAGPGANQALILKTFRQPIWPHSYEVVERDSPRAIAPSVLNTFSGLSIPVKAGDILGLNDGTTTNACDFEVLGDSIRQRQGDLGVGQSGIFNTGPNVRLNLTATIQPTNTFKLGVASKNKRKGTASVAVTVPNPGQVSLAEKGAKGAAGATAAVAAPVPGIVHLTIRAKGKKKRKLNDKGKVTLAPTITFKPTSGDARAQSLKVKLRKTR